MVTPEDIICIPLTEEEIFRCIEKAISFFSIARRDNLRARHINIQFDCILRGYAGEYAMDKWLREKGIEPAETNIITDGENIDIDFLYRGANMELKTSMLPDSDGTLQKAIENRDIKLIKRQLNIGDLKGDIHLQIFFNQRRKSKDDWLLTREINIETASPSNIYDTLLARAYKGTIFFVGWIDKQRLITTINALPEKDRTWTFAGSKRDFWNCNITGSKKPAELPAYLLSL